tara:strand:- start:90 stop:440 length:351 start_codon:yes stop_codon:yes gene_type:complete
MSRSKKILIEISKHYGQDLKKVVLTNEALINKDKFQLSDLKIKESLLIAPTGQSVLIHYSKGMYYYTLNGADWDNHPSYKHFKTMNELKPMFLEALNNGAKLGSMCPMYINKYFND